MATKNEKASPIRIPEEVFGMCNSDQEPLLLQLRNQIDGCKTIFEEMNFFGLLKQEIKETVPPNVVKFIVLAYILPSCQGLHKSTSVLLSIFCNRFLSTVYDIYGEVTNWLISNEFIFSFKENGSDDQITILSSWLSLPHLNDSLTLTSASSILQLFYPLSRQYVDNAMKSQAIEYKQQQISLVTTILKNCYLLCQGCPSVITEMNYENWYSLTMDVVKTLCTAKEDCVGVSQLWLLLTRVNQSTENTVEALHEFMSNDYISSQLRILLYRELLLQIPFVELANLKDHAIEGIVKELCTLITTDSDEIVCIMQTCCLVFSLYKENKQTAPPSSIQQALQYILLYLDSNIRKLSHISEDCLLSLIQSISHTEYVQYVQPILQQLLVSNQVSRKVFAVLTILLQCETASSIFKIHPTLIQFLLSQLTERNSSLCSQVTSVLIMLLLRMYEELGKEKRDSWFMICVDPIIDTVYTTKSKNQHIFSYVLPSLLNIKTNLLSKTLLKEYQDVKEGKEGYDQSIFKLSHYFMDQIRKRDDEETSVLFLLNVLRVDKQSGLIGKEPGDYLGNQPYQLPIALAEKYGQCGNDEIRLALFDLICSSLYTTLPLCELEWDLIQLLLQNCYQSENPHYRHEVCVSFTRLCSRITMAVNAVMKKCKRFGKTTVFDLVEMADKTNCSKEIEKCILAGRKLTDCCNMLFEVISPSTPGHSLLILTDLLTTLLSQFNHQSALPLQLQSSQVVLQKALLLVSNQNTRIRESGIDILQSLFCYVSKELSNELLSQIKKVALRTEGMLTDYEVDITASHILLLYDMIQSTNWDGWLDNTIQCTNSDLLLHKPLQECTMSEQFLLYLLSLLEADLKTMHSSVDLPFTQYPIFSCQGVLRGLLLICTRHPSVLTTSTLFTYFIYLYYNIYRESLVIVADSSIYSSEEEESAGGDELSKLLAKGPIQVEDEGLITEEDHIAKNKLDCRGHIIGEADPIQAKHLKKLMLASWLICKHSSQGIATMLSLLPDSRFETCSDAVYIEDLRQLESYLKKDSFVPSSDVCWFSNQDLLYLLWNMLISVLTIKHIGGILFVADSITLILQRLTKIALQNAFIAGLPSFLISILLDESNINNRNFILRRSTGYSTAICSILSSSPALVKQVLCRLFLLAAPSVDYFASLPAGCFHPSLVTPIDSLKTTWKSRVHALNILRQVYLDHTIEIQDHLYEPALMLAIEGITSPVWQVKNSGLMLYTVIVKKILSNRVNEQSSEKNLNISTFFIKYPFLRHWFSYKLDLIQSIHAEEFGTAGLNPVLFAFIVLTSRLSGCTTSIEDEWLVKITKVISEVNSSSNLFCRTMSARALSILIPLQDHGIYCELLIKHLLTQPLSQNEIHGILLQILFILNIASQRHDDEMIHHIITTFMNNTEVIFSKLRVDFVRFTFFEITFVVIQFTNQYDHVLFIVISNYLRNQQGTIGDILCVRSMYAVLATLALRIPIRGIHDERYSRGIDVLKKCFTQTNAHEIVLALKKMREFYRALNEEQRSSLYKEYFDEVTKVLCDQITSQKLPRYAMKSFLKTVVLLRSYVQPLSSDTTQYLLSLVKQTANMEIAYWATRFIVCCLSRKLISNEMIELCEDAIMKVVSRIDITLSYRSMLADICVIASEDLSASHFLSGVSLLISCLLIEDANSSIQHTILKFIQKKGGFEGITIGVKQAHQFIREELLKDMEAGDSFCRLTVTLLVAFVSNNQPNQLIAEMEEVYKNDSSCAVPIVVISTFNEISRELKDTDVLTPLRNCMRTWKEEKEKVAEEWKELSSKKTDKLEILEVLCDLSFVLS